MASSVRESGGAVHHLTKAPEFEIEDGTVYVHLVSGGQRFCDSMSIHLLLRTIENAKQTYEAWERSQGCVVANHVRPPQPKRQPARSRKSLAQSELPNPTKAEPPGWSAGDGNCLDHN